MEDRRQSVPSLFNKRFVDLINHLRRDQMDKVGTDEVPRLSEFLEMMDNRRRDKPARFRRLREAFRITHRL